MPQFAKSFSFDLADALAGDIKNLADFFESFHAPIVEAIAQSQHIALSGTKGRQYSFEVFA